jgi:hypothetical protein
MISVPPGCAHTALGGVLCALAEESGSAAAPHCLHAFILLSQIGSDAWHDVEWDLSKDVKRPRLAACPLSGYPGPLAQRDVSGDWWGTRSGTSVPVPADLDSNSKHP